MIVASFSTVAGGVWIEEIPGRDDRTGSERCFRFDKEGRAEYAILKDAQERGAGCRWFGHVYTIKDFTLC